MNAAVKSLRAIRPDPLPQDSGPWAPVQPVFKQLRRRTPNVKSRRRAQLGLASLLAISCHTALLGVLMNGEIGSYGVAILLVPVVPVAGTFLGLFWVAQFVDLDREKAILAALVWSGGAVPASLLISPKTMVITLVLQIIWIVVAMFAALAAHKILGGRP